MLLWLLLLLFLPLASRGSSDCPSSCVCKWKNGKETTECVGAGIEGIPRGVALGTQVNIRHIICTNHFYS